jgi:hypothetical protein
LRVVIVEDFVSFAPIYYRQGFLLLWIFPRVGIAGQARNDIQKGRDLRGLLSVGI